MNAIHPALLPVRTAEAAARLLTAPPFANGGAFIATLNPELLARACISPAFADLLHTADGRICDGIGSKLLLKLNRPDKSVPRIAGIDLGHAVLQLAAHNGEGVFLLGGRSGVAKEAAERLMRSIPHLKISGVCHGYFGKADLPAMRGMIRRSGARILIVCLGSPLQEEWVRDNRRYLPNVRLFLPLGGSLDVWAGKVERAPLIWRRAGLEWLWRISHEPRRIRRLASASVILCHALLKSANLFQIE